MKRFIVIFCSIILFTSSLSASELIFQFTNPSFGGNPLNGSFLLQQAQIQNKFKEKTEKLSIMEQLNPAFQAQYLGNILEGVYKGDITPNVGDNYELGGLTILVKAINGNIVTFLITDTSSGQQWTYQIPISTP